MKIESIPFDSSRRKHFPIQATENPKTPIKHDGPALNENLKNKDKIGKVILPQVKLHTVK